MKWFLIGGALVDLSKVVTIQCEGLRVAFLNTTGVSIQIQLDSVEQVAHAFEAMKQYLEAVYPVLPEASKLVRN